MTARPGAVTRALVVTVSNRAAAGVYAGPRRPADRRPAWPTLGFAVDGPRVVPDGDPVEQALRAAVADGYDVVLTTGGTGISARPTAPPR